MRVLPTLLLSFAVLVGCQRGATVQAFNQPYDKVVEAVRAKTRVTSGSDFFGHRVEAREVRPGHYHLRSEFLLTFWGTPAFVDEIDVASAGDNSATVAVRSTDHRFLRFGGRDRELEALVLQGITSELERPATRQAPELPLRGLRLE
jgi:hypothetical protein